MPVTVALQPAGLSRASTGGSAGRFYLFVLAILVLLASVQGQTPSAEFSGMWTATEGNGPAVRGMWLAQISKGGPNAASGSWSLVSEGGQVVLEGTWSARNTSQNFEGSWSARARNGRSLSGTWNAALGDFKGKTFKEMLALTMEKQVGGAWRSGRYEGNWWLEGPRKKRGS